jgi:hypothetical protein
MSLGLEELRPGLCSRGTELESEGVLSGVGVGVGKNVPTPTPTSILNLN